MIGQEKIIKTSRRTFLKTTAAVSGGLVLAFVGGVPKRLARADIKMAFEPNAFLTITSENKIKILLAHSEMGQGIWTSLPILIAEELDADWKTIEVEHAPAAPVYNHVVFGAQITGGSTTMISEFMRYRQAGAAARDMLLRAAAQRTEMDISRLKTEGGFVIAGDKRFTYGELADEAGKLEAPAFDKVKLKDAKDWKYIGKSVKRLDSKAKTTGRAQFGMDVQFDGLMTAMVSRSPAFGGKVKSFDGAEAMKVPGVKKVVQIPSGVAVVATNYWSAKKGREALKVDWDLGPGANLNSEKIKSDYIALSKTKGTMAAQKGNPDDGFGKAAKVIEAQYFVPYLAHAPMEPLNCTVKLAKDRCDIWAGTQFQTMDQGMAAAVTGLRPDQIFIHTTFLGGGFGRRATPVSDFVTEAVHVAKAAEMPVKTVWSRDDDIRGGWYRPAFAHNIKVGLNEKGRPIAWRQGLAGQSITKGTAFESVMVQNGIDITSVEGTMGSPYITETPNHELTLHSPESPIPVLWWRAVAHTHSGFVMETFIDDLAKEAGVDPAEYRKPFYAHHPRHLRVMETVLKKAGWGKKLKDGHAHGLAVHESFGSFVAQVAEVSLKGNEVVVHKVTCAVDCGLAVNPDNIAAQMESGVIFGLSAALYGELHIENGGVKESNFHDYPVVRIDNAPIVETHIVPSTDQMGGVGEVATPPIAPAVGNAIFALTGKRLRELPFKLA